jgi:hypothetical protein
LLVDVSATTLSRIKSANRILNLSMVTVKVVLRQGDGPEKEKNDEANNKK